MEGKKTGGRQKGTPNKTTTALREVITNIFRCNMQQIEEDLQSLDPHERIVLMEKLLPYVLPKLNNTNSDFNGQQPNSMLLDWFGE